MHTPQLSYLEQFRSGFWMVVSADNTALVREASLVTVDDIS